MRSIITLITAAAISLCVIADNPQTPNAQSLDHDAPFIHKRQLYQSHSTTYQLVALSQQIRKLQDDIIIVKNELVHFSVQDASNEYLPRAVDKVIFESQILIAEMNELQERIVTVMDFSHERLPRVVGKMVSNTQYLIAQGKLYNRIAEEAAAKLWAALRGVFEGWRIEDEGKDSEIVEEVEVETGDAGL